MELKAAELEQEKKELERNVDELEEANEHLKRQHQAESDAKVRLSQEASRLTAENMASVCVCAYSVCGVQCVCVCAKVYSSQTHL